MALAKNEIICIEITGLSSDGSGVGRADGQAVFVPATAPGDVARVRIVRPMKTHAFGILEELITPSPKRAPNDCEAFPRCGGCCFRHIAYPEELSAKQQIVTDAFQRIGKLDLPILPILPSPRELRYRNKAIYPLGMVDGHVTPGFFAGRSHRLVPCTDCKLQPTLLNEIALLFCSLADRFGISVYEETSHRGLLRHLYLRCGEQSGQVMVCIVINGQELPHAGQICRAITQQFPAVTTILINHNTQRTNVVLGPRSTVLHGTGRISDTLCGLEFSITAPSFYQVNHDGAERLYAVARDFADLPKDSVLLDLYCGIGTIGLSMADQCRELIGVEIVPSAVEMAQENAKRAGITNARFIHADAAEAAASLVKTGLRPNVVIVDPPRKGCDQPTLDAIMEMSPEKIVMVSCDPATAARDAAYLTKNGYCAIKVQPVDMFPRTKHVESVILMIHCAKTEK